MAEKGNATRRKPLIEIFKEPLIRKADDNVKVCGLINFRQTSCFMNSVIQCLQYIPVWRNYLFLQHPRFCNTHTSSCLACSFAREASLSSMIQTPTFPFELINKLRLVSKEFAYENQQDAHEYLICLIGKLQEQMTRGLGRLKPRVEMTTAVGKIFGGFLSSIIVCKTCGHVSNTYEQFFNLSLVIENFVNVYQALDNLFKSENIHEEPFYKCRNCRRRRYAEKKYEIDSLPEVLILHLKRYDMLGRKLHHIIKYPEVLNVEKYVSSDSSSDRQTSYRLTGIIVHYGPIIHMGHYISIVRYPGKDTWAHINDNDIMQISDELAKNQDAYMLFYEKITQNEGTNVEKEDVTKHLPIEGMNLYLRHHFTTLQQVRTRPKRTLSASFDPRETHAKDARLSLGDSSMESPLVFREQTFRKCKLSDISQMEIYNNEEEFEYDFDDDGEYSLSEFSWDESDEDHDHDHDIGKSNGKERIIIYPEMN